MTYTMFAATGWTQASWFFKLAICWMAVIYMLSRVILSWRVWSWKPVLLAAGLALGTGLLFTPWSGLADLKSSDPNVLLWHRWFRVMASAWMFAAAASFLSLVLIWMLRRRPAAPGQDELWLFIWRPWKNYRATHSNLRPMTAADRGGDVVVESERIPNTPGNLKMAKTAGAPSLPTGKPEP